ncbi:Armadillo repeat-containing protein 2 [Lamellibrachia satsuma]|nr:Armadillo repeat-containing protein 2 [Lamellibrachia satsuma]
MFAAESEFLALLQLKLKVSGNNLINVCKLVFKVSRDEKNDIYFLDDNILDLLIETAGNVDHISVATESLVYCVGALKFLSASSVVVRHLVKRGAVQVLAGLLAGVNAKVSETSENKERLGHILIQLTAMLRNLADVTTTRHDMLSNGVIEELCKLLDSYQDDADLMLNVTRIFSKLTLHTDCCTELSSKASHFALFICLLNQHHSREVSHHSVVYCFMSLRGGESSFNHLLFHVILGSHAFLLEFQAVSPGYRIVVQLKWHFINFIDSMEIFVRFNHVSSCSSIVEAWELKRPEPVTIFEVLQFWD